MFGIIVDVSSVALGGLIGTACKRFFSPYLTSNMNLVFGVCAIVMGINSVILMSNMPPVIFALIIGTLIGLVLHLSDQIAKLGEIMQRPIAKIAGGATRKASDEEYFALLLTGVILFCFSGTGIYGCLDAGMTGNYTILLSKSVLDFFTAIIFACTLGPVTSIIAIPQFLIFTVLIWTAKLILPLTTPIMINDFRACGGFLLIATGARLAKMQNFPVAEMLPGMVLVMPMSALWTAFIVPLL